MAQEKIEEKMFDPEEEELLDPETLSFSPVRKLPVTVEAAVTSRRVRIKTLEGIMRADAGDYIVRGVKGEYYPVKPDIFASTYEPVGKGTVLPRSGALRILNERLRQITFEHYDEEHDRQNVNRELVEAAIGYAAAPERLYRLEYVRSPVLKDGSEGQPVEIYFSDLWPGGWDERHDKREKHGAIRRLEIAGALIAAEIDRLLAQDKANTPLTQPGGMG